MNSSRNSNDTEPATAAQMILANRPEALRRAWRSEDHYMNLAPHGM